MSGRNSEYIYLAYLTEKRHIGESTKRSPQHLTLVPPFAADTPLSRLQSVVREVAAETKPIKIKLAKEAKFGPNKNIDVLLAEPRNVISMLHYQLMYALKNTGASLPVKYVFEAFLPHITIKRTHGTKLHKNQLLTIDHIAIMYKDKGHRTMLAQEPLTGKGL